MKGEYKHSDFAHAHDFGTLIAMFHGIKTANGELLMQDHINKIKDTAPYLFVGFLTLIMMGSIGMAIFSVII